MLTPTFSSAFFFSLVFAIGYARKYSAAKGDCVFSITKIPHNLNIPAASAHY